MEDALRIAKEKAEAASAAKDDFISNMEHDLRTPFSGIGGIANMLHDIYAIKYPEMAELLQLMIQSCTQWEMIHNRIFDVLVVEKPHSVQHQDVLLVELLQDIQKLMLATLSTQKLTLKMSPVPHALSVIKTDPLKLKLILSSIVSNAIKFTKKGGIKITVKREGPFCVIRVIDSGIGIPTEQFEYIFEKFTKLSRSNQYGDDFKGLGLGLYAAKQYIDALHGRIEVKSQLGRGSTFLIKLPLHSAAQTSVPAVIP